jgi:predicted nicotinamide N-methyase
VTDAGSRKKPSELAELRASLERRFRIAVTRLSIGGHSLSLLHPENADELIDERDFEIDERLPYWADIWPSARVLAGYVAARQGMGRSMLELGCGAGLVATCAALAGFAVHATDYYEDALRFTRLNVWENSGQDPGTQLVDWRHLPADLGHFDLVVASDVLYERAYARLVARAIAASLTRRGEALIADPGRVAAGDFVRSAADHGLEVVSREEIPFVEGIIRQTITIYRFKRG